MIYALLWQFTYGQVRVIITGMLGTPREWWTSACGEQRKPLLPCWDVCSKNPFSLVSTLVTTCTNLWLTMSGVCLISEVSTCDGWYTRSVGRGADPPHPGCYWQLALPTPFTSDPQQLTAGPVTATCFAPSSLHHTVSMTFFAQSNLPWFGLFHWSGLAAAAAISQRLT